MVKTEKCIRCKQHTKSQNFCQNCKDELLSFFETTQDWQLAYDMEVQEQFVHSLQKDLDINNYVY